MASSLFHIDYYFVPNSELFLTDVAGQVMTRSAKIDVTQNEYRIKGDNQVYIL
jgi:hypothetical protein